MKDLILMLFRRITKEEYQYRRTRAQSNKKWLADYSKEMDGNANSSKEV